MFNRLHLFFFRSRGGRGIQRTIRRKERAREHHELMDASDHIYEQAEAPSSSYLPGPSAAQPATETPSPPLVTTPETLLILSAAEASLPPAAVPSPQTPAPRPPHNRHLEFDAHVNPPATAKSVQELSQTLAADSQLTDDSALPPDSRRIYCSQYRHTQHGENKTTAEEGNGLPQHLPQVEGRFQLCMAQHAEPERNRSNGPSCLHDKMNDWRQRCASPEATEASPDRYPTPPSAPDDDGLTVYSDSLCEGGQRYTANYKLPKPSPLPKSKPITVRYRDQVWVRKDHRDPRGLAPLCYVATGYEGPPVDGECHQGYLCYDKRDLKWAHRLRFHLNHLS